VNAARLRGGRIPDAARSGVAAEGTARRRAIPEDPGEPGGGLNPGKNPDLRFARAAAVVTISGPLAVMAVHLLRPVPASAPDALRRIAGVLPNFAAAVWLPFLIVPARRLLKKSPRIPARAFYAAAGMSAAFLFVWEFAQKAVWGIPVDAHDLEATIAGTALAVAIRLLSQRKIRFQRPPHRDR
jgi:hypothetical protein